MLIDSILPKWNPTMGNPDLSEELTLTVDELECNKKALETDQVTVFDPNFTLSHMTDGFRILAFEESLNEIAARRSKIPGTQPTLITVFLHAYILHPGEFEPLLEVMIKTVTDTTQENESLGLFTVALFPAIFYSLFVPIFSVVELKCPTERYGASRMIPSNISDSLQTADRQVSDPAVSCLVEALHTRLWQAWMRRIGK
ncbi:hypothetical protein C8R44DRAFT_743999 [Mycena epipterygia]|nr:hypothetical protein C8R44DRAFT_743999 [Mycena epipterygia]